MTQIKKQKLELTWIGKEKRPRLEPRIFLDDTEWSYQGEPKEGTFGDNLLIHGDNLLALKALEQDYAGKVKCVFIDPPYNTGSAFAQYDDGLEHSMWLTLIRDRLELLYSLLSDDGSLWISIDDNEVHYLKVVCDQIFGRNNFVTSFIWRKVDSPNDNKVSITPDHEYILCYSKNIEKCVFKRKMDESILESYRQPDAESERPYRDRLLKKNGKSSLRSDRPSMYFPITDPDGNEVYPVHDDGRDARWAAGQDTVNKLISENLIVWKKRDKGWIPYTREYAPSNPTRPWPTIWNDLHTTRQTKAHLKNVLPSGLSFDTPKPEDLLARIIEMSSNEGELVLDSFAGSGTTGAVAQKMGRRWIMVELGDHCETHIVPRLKKVIEGEDQGGISKAVNWQGGGGFRYLRLAPSLLQKDEWGNWVINKEYNAEMLSAAMCKHMGFTYAPSETQFWNHGYSTETDFIYVTTGALAYDQLKRISEEVGEERTLLICCKAFMSEGTDFPNLTIKKIPQSILNKCEWDNDDYSFTLNVLAEPEEYDLDDEDDQ
ncbi:site-specific DNA-methyltransferase [Vibrio parahaemolyticus]|nr:site-specific DNA-methyltransferase [Vibrio parahaemolyticus]MDF5521630.1 site-specific DNA-methyltransferase [Vibrio parahaemolyticus]